MRGVRLKDPPGSGGGGSAHVEAADLTALGAFAIPNALDFGGGLTFRYVSGQFRLYGVSHINIPSEGAGGHLIEYLPIADGSLSLTGSSFAQASVLNDYGDIFQNEIYLDVDDGSGGGGPPKSGVVNTGHPMGLWWDPIDLRMYWCKTATYNNTTTTSDTCLGYSTLNDTLHTGLGIGMWKLSAPVNLGGYGNRWCTGAVPIPSAFATAYCGGRRIGVGFGGNMSVISNVFSVGPALFAVNPPAIGTDTDHTYMASAPVQLLNYPADVTRAPRASALYAEQDFPDAYAANTTVWGWNDGLYGGVSGVWINGANKQGVLFFTLLNCGNARSAIQASPTPTHTVFTVASIGDVVVGDYVRWPTDTTAANPSYKFCVGNVSAISGQQLTVTNIKNAYTDASDTSGIPVTGGTMLAGGWYQAGGTAATRWKTALYAYDPADLALIAAGATPYSKAPYLNQSWPLAGQPTHSPGGAPGSTWIGQPRGACFDPATNRLYVLHRECLNRGSSYDLVYVYTVNC